jgi:hypothetical protein
VTNLLDPSVPIFVVRSWLSKPGWEHLGRPLRPPTKRGWQVLYAPCMEAGPPSRMALGISSSRASSHAQDAAGPILHRYSVRRP